MKTVKLGKPLLIGDKHHKPGEVVLVADGIADQLIKRCGAEKADNADIANADASEYADAVDPLVPNADPLQAARVLSLVTEENPGLVALEVADKSTSKRRAARVTGKVGD